MKSRLHSAGFTLLEVLIAASLFSVVGMMATSVFLNLSRGQQQVSSRNTLYDDAQFILDQLTKEINSGSIDYEEYYNRIVIGGKPGMNHGYYAAQFYYRLFNNGKDSCAKTSSDCVNTGTNPSIGNFPDKSNAFYSSGVTSTIFCSGFEPIFTTSKGHACVKELYLLNPDGTKKTFIAPEKLDWGGPDKLSYVLSRASMISYADSLGNNSVPHVFRCENDINCSKQVDGIITQNIASPENIAALKYPDMDFAGAGKNPIEKAYNGGKDFVPFTPSRVNIKNIAFFISPTEDPHKAFAEANENEGMITNVHQPKVTIVLTLEPISNVKGGTSYPPLTVQTTVTPGLFVEVPSYPPQMVKKL